MKHRERRRNTPIQWPEGDLDALIFGDEEPYISER